MLTQTNLLEILQKYEIPAYYFSLNPNAKSLRQQATSDKLLSNKSKLTHKIAIMLLDGMMTIKLSYWPRHDYLS